MANPLIIALMFHRVHCPTTGRSPKQFERYLDYLVRHFPIVTPEDPLPEAPVVVYLTFDDAYFDFYHIVFPLLQRYQIKALLAVPTHYIVDCTNLDPNIRLSVPYPQGMQAPDFEEKVPFCTWQELHEMAQTPWVHIASHSLSHANLQDSATNLEHEIVHSKQVLEQKLQIPIRHFVYPFGKMTRKVHKEVCNHYDYGLRIGSALNRGWDKKNRYIYRIDAEHLWLQNKPIDDRMIHKLTRKYWLNRLRLK